MTRPLRRATRARVVGAKLRVMVLGSGGREHALAWALARSPSVKQVWVAPGNPGCVQAGETGLAPIARLQLESLSNANVVRLARAQAIDLVVVGPEAPLCAGVVDALSEAGVLAFGPSAAAARLEGSKAFMKRLAQAQGIPTAPFLVSRDFAEAERYIRGREQARIIKTDGLAAGKGAIVTQSADEAVEAARQMLLEGRFGAAGSTIIVEDRLQGVEISVHAISDGERSMVLPIARDHKRIADGDRGPNTGGMGAFAPVAISAELLARVQHEVLDPTLRGMREAGASYRGVLYAGLMVAPDGTPYLLEHNVRFGDPETQVLMPLLDGDVALLLRSAAAGKLDEQAATVAPDRAAVVLVMASAGYPESSRDGDAISGLEAAAQVSNAYIFHAGTRSDGAHIVTAGGRVLGVAAVAPQLASARERAYQAADAIYFDGMQLRRDIAASG